MKLNGRTLKRRLYGLTMLPDRVARVRHFRGHGVYSPFVYQIVRKVFMQKRFLGEERALYDRLIALGLSHRRAMQLQNLAVHLGYHKAAFDAWSAGCYAPSCRSGSGCGHDCCITHAIRQSRAGTTDPRADRSASLHLG